MLMVCRRMLRTESTPESPRAHSAAEGAERARLYRVSLLLLGLCLVPIGLSYVPGVSIATLVAPFVALEGLVLVTALARSRNALSTALALALSCWGAAAVLAAAGVVALEFSASIPEPPAALWLTKRACQNNHSAWILLCPFALMFDLLMTLFLALAYVAWAFGWLMEHLGAPVLLGAALIALLLGVAALRRPQQPAARGEPPG
jgi:hypothetical protein